jgi:hypothetical protein
MWCVYLWYYLAELFLWEISQTKVVEKIKTYMFHNFSENRGVYESVEKYATAGQTTDDNMAHANCMLDN